MQVVVGPVSAESVKAFVRFARSILEATGPGAEVPSDAASDFERYLLEWSELAIEGGQVTWSAVAEPEVGEYLVYAFYRVAKNVIETTGRSRVVPDDAAEFYWMLVSRLLDSLRDVGGSSSEFADHLREFWPGEQAFV